MKKLYAMVALSAISVAASAQGGPIGYPGSSWGTVTAPAGVGDTERNNTIFQGKTEQGIDWFAFGRDKKWRFNTYASVGYSADSDKLSYNNKFVPAIGMKVSRSFENGVVDIGVQAVMERRWITDTSGKAGTGTGVQAYASYWFGWDLKK